VDLLAPARTFDRYQQHHRFLAVPLAVIKKFGDDQGGNLAALVAYYAFFSIFPLLLVFVTVLGFVLQGDPNAQKSISDSVLAQFPVIGNDLKSNVHSLQGHTIALVVGIAGSLWGALGVTNAAQSAFDRVWAVPFKDRHNFFQARLRGLVLLVSLGLLFIVATVASGLVIGGRGGPLVKVAGIALALLLNFTLFLAAFRFLTSDTVPMRSLWVGVGTASVLWEVLQLVGGYYIGHVLRHASSTYGVFGFVIALLVFLRLGAQVTLYSAEVNVVLARKLWPRSLFGPEGPADEKTLTALAKVEERSDREQIRVEFNDPK
jgi:membrane protein